MLSNRRKLLQNNSVEIFGKIPSEAIERIWYGISHVPRRPQLCTDINEIFDRDITEKEFSTAPAPTGLTLNMMKKWPKVAKKTIFTAPCN